MAISRQHENGRNGAQPSLRTESPAANPTATCGR